jgi:predicted dehydrogenase
MGLVGAGVQGRLHARTLLTMDSVELVAVADPSDVGQDWARSQGLEAVGSMDELIDRVDAVSICMPDHLHEDATIAALGSGKRVILEKPMAVSTDSCDRILEAAAVDPDALMIGHVLRFDPRVIRARELVMAGDLGDVWHVKVWRCTSQAVGAGIWDRTSVAWFLGIHDIDLVRFVTGLDAELEWASGRRFLSSTIDVVHAALRLSNGGLLSMENNWTLPHGRPSRADAGIRIIGSRGSVEVDLSHTDLLHVDRDGAGNYLDTRFWPAGDGGGAYNLLSELGAFVESARRGGPSPVSGADGREAVRVIESIQAALDRAS